MFKFKYPSLGDLGYNYVPSISVISVIYEYILNLSLLKGNVLNIFLNL